MDDINFQELRQQKSIQNAAELAVEKVSNAKFKSCNIFMFVFNTDTDNCSCAYFEDLLSRHGDLGIIN